MTTRPKGKSEDVIADGRQVLARMHEHQAAFEEADRNRKAKLISSAFLARYEKTLADAERAVGAQQVLKHVVSTATKEEEGRRATIFTELSNIRAEVRLAYPTDPAIGRAFGVGAKLASRSTPGLLAAAGMVIESFEEPSLRKAAIDAGVTAQRVKSLGLLRDQLAQADTTQNLRISARKGNSVDKLALLRELKAGTAHIRKVAQLIFRTQPQLLAQFKSTLARHTPRKRQSTPPAAVIA